MICAPKIYKVISMALLAGADAFVVHPSLPFVKPNGSRPTLLSTRLTMGLLDSISSFLQDREGDFVKLDDSGTAFGPGPLLLLYNVPPGIEDDEVYDMISDGAPQAFRQGVTLTRLCRNDSKLLDLPLSDALEQIVNGAEVTGASTAHEASKCPVLFFSGFLNEEMMATYNIVGKEIYEEAGGSVMPACAKAVRNAMGKPLRQVLDEISGDHEEALSTEGTET